MSFENKSTLTRDEAFELVKKYNKDTFHIRHALTVEGVMRWFAADELTGLVWSAALMRPSKSCKDMELSSLKKKFKDKKFAAGCSRDVIRQGAEQLGWELDVLLEKTLDAMKASEDSIAQAME